MHRNWDEVFIEALRKCPNVTAAIEAAGISRAAAYKKRSVDEDFRTRWEDAIHKSLDGLEEAVFARAIGGSDQLAIFLLKSHRRDTYGDQMKVQHGGIIQLEWGDPAPDAGAASGPEDGEGSPCPV